MRWSFILLLVALGLGALPATSGARCKGRCRQVARACKQRCRIAHRNFGPRRQCIKVCRSREQGCKLRCP